MLKNSRGNLTEKQLERCSKMSGIFGEKMGHLLMSSINDEPEYHSTGKSFDERYKEDVRRYVLENDEERPFEYVAGRKVQGIPGIQSRLTEARVHGPFSMGQYLKSRSIKMDSFRNVARATATRRARQLAERL